MKKTLLICLFGLICTSFPVVAVATTATDSAQSGSESAVQKPKVPSVTLSAQEETEAKKLRERLANKVAEITQKNNKAVSGFIKEKQKGSFVLVSLEDSETTIKLDDTLTKYYQVTANKRQEIKYEDISKGDFVIVSGVSSDDAITANFVYIDEVFKVFSGKVTEVDASNYQLKVITTEKDNFVLNIESATKQYLLNVKTLELEKSGFSKIKEGDTIHFIYKFIQKDKDSLTVTPQRLVIIPQEYFQK